MTLPPSLCFSLDSLDLLGSIQAASCFVFFEPARANHHISLRRVTSALRDIWWQRGSQAANQLSARSISAIRNTRGKVASDGTYEPLLALAAERLPWWLHPVEVTSFQVGSGLR